MRSSRKAVAVFLSGISLFSFAAWAVPAERITRAVDSRNMTAMPRNVHPMARPEFDRGALDPSQMMHRMLITFSRTAAQQQALDKLNVEQQDPSSANYHKWLTPEQFAAQFGMAQADLDKVKSWLVSQGFMIDEVARGGDYIAFTGSVGQVNAAFKTELHQYAMNGEVHFANATAPSVPTAMANVVSSLRSLTDFSRPRPRARARRIKPDFTSGLSGNTFLTPDDFATIYNLNALYNSGIDGTGQKIAVVGQSDLVLSEVATFRKVSGLSVNAPQVILNGPDPGVVSGDVDEASLDVEWSGAVARNATIVYVNSGGTTNGVFDALYYAIDNQTAPVISISYGLCEADEGSFLSQDEAELQKAWTQGQVVVGPAGDDAASDCDFSSDPNIIITSATLGLAVDFPASSEFVVGVGGTVFNEGSGTFWSTTNNSLSGSALFYIPEVVWNDTSAAAGIVGTGGGVSALVAKPSWQTGTGVPNDGFRDVPDIALNAGDISGHDSYITCSAGDCNVCFPGATGEPADPNCPVSSNPGYRSDTTSWGLDVLAGTSAGVPTFAGMVALLNQKMGTPQGQITPKLYTLAAGANGANIFHDITAGNNVVPCTPGTPPSGPASIQCPSFGNFGYSAGVGYDQVTGLGTIDAYNFVTDWSGTAPAADFGVQFFNSTVSVTRGSTTNVLVRVQKQNGFTGNVAFSCTSSITGVTCSATPTSVTPDGTTTVAITASTTASLRAPATHGPFMPWWESAFGVAALFGMGKKRNKRQMIAIALFLAALMIGLASCGGGGSSSSGTTTTTGGGTGSTTTGTVTLTATSGTLSHSTQISVTVN